MASKGVGDNCSSAAASSKMQAEWHPTGCQPGWANKDVNMWAIGAGQVVHCEYIFFYQKQFEACDNNVTTNKDFEKTYFKAEGHMRVLLPHRYNNHVL